MCLSLEVSLPEIRSERVGSALTMILPLLWTAPLPLPFADPSPPRLQLPFDLKHPPVCLTSVDLRFLEFSRKVCTQKSR